MKRLILIVFVIAAAAFVGLPRSLSAQIDTSPYPPPHIVFFASEVGPSERANIETLQTPIHVSWQVEPLMQQYRVLLHVYRDVYWGNVWEELLFPAAATLPASGSVDLLLRRPVNAVPQFVRLVVLDEDDTLLDQRVMLPGYEIPYDPPHIDVFYSATGTLDRAALVEQTARVEVDWWVRNFGPDMRIQFEQRLSDGRVFSVDPPHPAGAIAPQGSAYLTPLLPESGNQIHLWLRVISGTDDTTLTEMALSPITVVDSDSSPAVSPADTAQFCDDPRALDLVTTVRTAVRYHDGALLASLVGPQGLYITLKPSQTNHLTPDEVSRFFDDWTSRSWGVSEYGPEDAPPIQAALAGAITTQLEIDLLPGTATIACNDVQDGKRLPDELPTIMIPDYEIVNFYSVMRPGPPGWELEFSGWGLVIDYWQGEPVLLALANYVWFP